MQGLRGLAADDPFSWSRIFWIEDFRKDGMVKPLVMSVTLLPRLRGSLLRRKLRTSGTGAMAMDFYLKCSEIMTLAAHIRLDTGEPPTQLPPAVLAIGFATQRFQALSETLADKASVVIRSPRLTDLRSPFWFAGGWRLHRISHLLVDVTALGGLGRCRQDLRRIHDMMPDLPILLLDAEVRSPALHPPLAGFAPKPRHPPVLPLG